jgi:hypothetical protein
MNNKFSKLIAGVQILGGAILMISCIIETLAHLQKGTTFWIVFFLAFIVFVYSTLATYYGLLLWKDHPSAYTPSALIWSLQIPVVISGPLSFTLVTGFGFILKFVGNSVGFMLGFDMALGERHLIYINTQSSMFALGVNVFAIYCVHVLRLQSKKNARLLPSPQQSKQHFEGSECDIPFERDSETIKINSKVDYTDRFVEKWKSGEK